MREQKAGMLVHMNAVALGLSALFAVLAVAFTVPNWPMLLPAVSGVASTSRTRPALNTASRETKSARQTYPRRHLERDQSRGGNLLPRIFAAIHLSGTRQHDDTNAVARRDFHGRDADPVQRDCVLLRRVRRLADPLGSCAR